MQKAAAIFLVLNASAYASEMECAERGSAHDPGYAEFSTDYILGYFEGNFDLKDPGISLMIQNIMLSEVFRASAAEKDSGDQNYSIMGSIWFVLYLHSILEKLKPEYQDQQKALIERMLGDTLLQFYFPPTNKRSVLQLRKDLDCFVRCAHPDIRFDQTSRSKQFHACLLEE